MNAGKILIGDTLEQITPELVAEMFSNMDSSDQAKFFNEVANQASDWVVGMASFAIQLEYVTTDDALTIEGRAVMDQIGNYSQRLT
jgi:hypothetical protein